MTKWIDAAGNITEGDCPLGARAATEAEVAAWEMAVQGDFKAAARARIIAYADGITARITARYPAAEVASWPTQAIEAQAIKGGGAATGAPLLSVLAAAWGMTLEQVADAVLAKATAYRAVTTAVITIRDAAMRAIDAAPDAAAVQTALADVREQADTAAAQLGLT